MTFLVSANPVAGQPFDVTIGGMLLKEVQSCQDFFACSVNGGAYVTVWDPETAESMPGKWSITFSLTSDQATSGDWNCTSMMSNVSYAHEKMDCVR